jgi:hypothetical protein
VAPDLDSGCAHVEALLGVPTQPGGQHLGLGTHNRLIGLGPTSYLEVVSPDPTQPSPPRSRWFGLDQVDRPHLATWCVSSHDLDAVVASARAAGLDLGEIRQGERERPDGSRLAWRMTDPWADRAGGLVPFFIDWGVSRHPGSGLPAVCRFEGVHVEVPDPEPLAGWFDALGLTVPVVEAEVSRIVASIRTPEAVVELS